MIHSCFAFQLNRAYMQGQIGNPKGAEKPNKKFYDPRTWMRKAEESLIARVLEAFKGVFPVWIFFMGLGFVFLFCLFCLFV